MKTVFSRGIGLALLLTATVVGPSVALAQNPPPGAILDMATSFPGVLGSYTQYNTSFVADITGTEYVSFAFREVPAFWHFDDASVVLNGTATNLLVDGDFEASAGVVGSNFPVGWSRWIQPIDSSAIGVVSNGSCHGGSVCWSDGSVEGYDGIYQGISTTLGQTYNISFWLFDDSDSAINNPNIDMLVYAGDTIPVGSVTIGGVPEPLTFGLTGFGLAALGFVRFRRRRAS